MRKAIIPATLTSLMLCCTLVACGQPSADGQATNAQATGSQQTENQQITGQSDTNGTAEGTQTVDQSEATGTTDAESNAQTSANQATTSGIGTVSNTIATDEDALVATYPEKFVQKTYTDADTNLSVTYNLFLPEGYDAAKSYPMVVFIADSSCAKGDAEQSLTQGLGALVWATDEWQAAHPTIVCVPTYPETILDDHGSYTTTEYVELTKRLIDSVSNEYAVDKSRVYGTGQSMGCMTTLILASEYPDLYAACMFVDGQWDVSTLKGLENQRFVYFAAEDDASAFAGMSEVMSMFDADSVSYASAQWDGNWTPDELSAAASDLFGQGRNANFVSWATGTIDASTSRPGGSAGGFGAGSASGEGEQPNAGGPSGNGPSAGSPAGGAGQPGGMGGASYHMASFDYAYRCIAVMEWLFQQS